VAKQAWIYEAKGWVLRTLQPVDEPTFRRLGWWRIVETGKFVNEQDEMRGTGPRK
jgi:hypothetical protein